MMWFYAGADGKAGASGITDDLIGIVQQKTETVQGGDALRNRHFRNIVIEVLKQVRSNVVNLP